MIARPEATLGEIAAQLNCSQGWLSIVKNSDVFVDYWALRSAAHSEAVTSGIKEKSFALMEMSLDTLIEDVEQKTSHGIMTAAEARENFELVTKRFGFDGRSQPQGAAPQTINLNIGLVSPSELETARRKLRQVDVTDVEALGRSPAKALTDES